MEALAEALKQVHGCYASYWKAAHTSGGMCGRGGSIPAHGRGHLWTALRYAERNPVRARLVAERELKCAHLGATAVPNTTSVHGLANGETLKSQ